MNPAVPVILIPLRPLQPTQRQPVPAERVVLVPARVRAVLIQVQEPVQVPAQPTVRVPARVSAQEARVQHQEQEPAAQAQQKTPAVAGIEAAGLEAYVVYSMWLLQCLVGLVSMFIGALTKNGTAYTLFPGTIVARQRQCKFGRAVVFVATMFVATGSSCLCLQ